VQRGFGGGEVAGMISFVIPAHNEAALIGRTLAAVHDAARAVGEPYEAIVVDDASTDGTAALARSHGARVVAVHHRRIAATRNAGARASAGELLFFVDADTVVTVRAVRAAVRALRGGAVGGGALVRFDGPVPLYAAVLERAVLPVVLPLLRMAPGCFLYCTRRAYLAAGGFDEGLAWSEEVAFGDRLKRLGRFALLRERVVTSGRKVRAYSAWGLLRVGVRLALGRPEGLEYWYGPWPGATADAEPSLHPTGPAGDLRSRAAVRICSGSAAGGASPAAGSPACPAG
jgi:glycosyltransferase involved in cell wall biosynthesis